MTHFYTLSPGAIGFPGAFHKGQSKWLLRQKHLSGECTSRQQTSSMQEPDLLAYLSHCLLIPKSNSLHRLYHQFLLFFTVGLCFTISFSPLILACLGEANHPKKFLGESPDAAIKYIKRCLFAQLIKGVETVPSYKEQECYYLIMDSCFTLLQKSVLLNI